MHQEGTLLFASPTIYDLDEPIFMIIILERHIGYLSVGVVGRRLARYYGERARVTKIPVCDISIIHSERDARLADSTSSFTAMKCLCSLRLCLISLDGPSSDRITQALKHNLPKKGDNQLHPLIHIIII